MVVELTWWYGVYVTDYGAEYITKQWLLVLPGAMVSRSQSIELSIGLRKLRDRPSCQSAAAAPQVKKVFSHMQFSTPRTSLNKQNMWEKWNESDFRPLLCTYRLHWDGRASWGWWVEWGHCPPDTGFKIQTLEVWGRTCYLSVTEAPHNMWDTEVNFNEHRTAGDIKPMLA